MSVLPRRRRLRALAWRLRFCTAAVCFGLATTVAVHAARPAPPSTAPVVVAARTLEAGTVLTADDVRVARIPAHLVPHDAERGPAAVVGRTTMVAVSEGLPLVSSLTGGGLTVGSAPPGTVVAPVRLDPAVAAVLSPGDHVDLLTTDRDESAPPTADGKASSGPLPADGPYLARSAVVIPAPEHDDGGLLGGDTASGILLVAVAPAEAEQIAARGSVQGVTAVLVP